MFDVKKEVNNALFDAFRCAVNHAYKHDVVIKKIADVKVGNAVFHDGLTFVVSKTNGIITLADDTTYDFMTAIKTKIYTV